MAEWTPELLKSHFDALNRQRTILVGVVAMAVLTIFFTARGADNKAVATALAEADKTMEFHNDLIRKGERDAAKYVTWGNIYSALGTLLVVAGLYLAYMALLKR